MKTRFLRILTLLMAFIVLFTSTGFGLIEHSCAMRGKSMRLTHAIHKADGSCCASQPYLLASHSDNSQTTQFKKTPCCKEEHRFEKLESSSVTEIASKLLKKAIDTVVYAFTQLAVWLVEVIISTIQGIASKESILLFFGRSFLAFAQIFLI